MSLDLWSPNTPHDCATDWRSGLPELRGSHVTLRELRRSDASSLLQNFANEKVTRFLAQPPPTLEAYERFVAWTHRKCAEGSLLCFGIVPDDEEAAVGLFQVWPRDGDFESAEMGFESAEMGFVLGPPFWGTGVFMDCARVFLEFVFETLGVHRLEARAATMNGRGNGALRKLGAVAECTLRQCFECGGQYQDHVMWSILDEDWREAAAAIEVGRHEQGRR